MKILASTFHQKEQKMNVAPAVEKTVNYTFTLHYSGSEVILKVQEMRTNVI